MHSSVACACAVLNPTRVVLCRSIHMTGKSSALKELNDLPQNEQASSPSGASAPAAQMHFWPCQAWLAAYTPASHIADPCRHVSAWNFAEHQCNTTCLVSRCPVLPVKFQGRTILNKIAIETLLQWKRGHVLLTFQCRDGKGESSGSIRQHRPTPALQE